MNVLAGQSEPMEIRPTLNGAAYTGATFVMRVSVVGGSLVGTYSCPETGAGTGIYRAASPFDTTSYAGQVLLFEPVESSPVARTWPGAVEVEVSRGLGAGLTSANTPVATSASLSSAVTTITSAVSSAQSAILSAVSALPSASTIANAVANLDVSAMTNAKLLGGAVTRLRKWLTWTSATPNRKAIVGQALKVYDDDGTTVLDSAPLTGQGGSVSPETGETTGVG